MTARKHHYVPEFYLKGFVKERERPRLFAVDLKSSSVFEPSPGNVCAERDFNRIDVDGHAPDALEIQFGNFEGEASLALRRVIDSRSITSEEDRTYVLNLIGLITTRNPRNRKIFRNFGERVNKQILAALISNPKFYATQIEKMKVAGYVDENSVVTYEEMRDFVERDEYTIDVPITECL